MGAWRWWKCRRSQLVGPLNGPQSGLAGWFMIFWINAWDAIMETHLSTGWLNYCKNPKKLELSYNTSYIKLHYFALCVFWYIVCVKYGVRNYSSNTKLGPTPNVKSHKIFTVVKLLFLIFTFSSFTSHTTNWKINRTLNSFHRPCDMEREYVI